MNFYLGLPHVHILLTVKKADKLRTVADIDKYVSASIPDPQKDPLLYEIVKSQMIHGPCDQGTFPCLDKDGKCSKRYPREFRDSTVQESDVSFSLP